MLQGKGLLEGCPQLEEVDIQSAFFDKGELGTALPPNMKSFRLGFLHPARMLPDLSPSAHTLEKVELVWCEKLEKISFLVEFGKLTTLAVVRCQSLVELTGLGFLRSLRFLHVSGCYKLRAIVGPFDNLRMLEKFTVVWCPLAHGLAGADLENLVSIKDLQFPLKRAHGRFNLKNLQKLETLRVEVNSWWDDESDLSSSAAAAETGGGGGMLEGLEGLVNLRSICLSGEQRSKAARTSLMSFSSLLVGLDHDAQSLIASGLHPSTSHLPNLRSLESADLENLTSLISLESLVQLRKLWVACCPKLKAVEGADAIVRSGTLRSASFYECESLEHLPISVDALREYEEIREACDEEENSDERFSEFSLSFTDCKFAKTEAVMAWAVNNDMPFPLRRASLSYILIDEDSMREAFFDGMFPSALNVLKDDNKCVNFKDRELQEKVGGVSKKDLMHKFQAHPECKLRLIEILDYHFAFKVLHKFKGRLQYAFNKEIINMIDDKELQNAFYDEMVDDSEEGSDDDAEELQNTR